MAPFGFALAGINLYWGLTQILIKHALLYMSSSMYATLRFGAAALLLAGIALVRGVHIDRTALRHGTVLGVLVGGQMLVSTYSLYFTSSTNAVFITQLSVVVVPTLCCWRARRLPSRRLVAAIVIVLMGLIVFTGVFSGALNVGDAIALFAMVGSCAQIIYGARVTARDDVFALTVVQMIAATALSLPCALLQGGTVTWTPEGAAIIVLTGLIGSGVCHSLMLVVQKHVRPAAVSFINVLYPVFAMMGAALIPDVASNADTITPIKLVGAMIVIGGMLVFVVGERVPAERKPEPAPRSIMSGS